MELDYESLRELVKKSLEECGGMVHPSVPSPITIIPSKKPDHEGKMAKRQVFGIVNDASQIEAMLTDEQQLDGWVQSKITKAADYIAAVKKFLEYEFANNPEPVMAPDEIPLPPMQEGLDDISLEELQELESMLKSVRAALSNDFSVKATFRNTIQLVQKRIEQKSSRINEESKSKNQQQLMGAALRCKRTGDCSGEQVKKLANSMSEKELEDFASTSHKGLPDKIDENSLADNAKEQSKGKKGDVRDVVKLMFNTERLGPALEKIKNDKREAAQLISIIGGQLGLTPKDLVDIAKLAARGSK